MRFLIAGGTGFVGQSLIPFLFKQGHEVLLLKRSHFSPVFKDHVPEAYQWDGFSPGTWYDAVEKTDVVINLCGDSVVSSRWSPAKKKKLEDSRILSTRAVVEAVASAKSKPSVVINASAVGFYGDSQDNVLDENSPCGNDYLADLCRKWEREAESINEISGVRGIRVRIGVVLGNSGGVMEKMIPPFKFGIGGPLGPGAQWVPWVHISDLVRIFEWLAVNDQISGACNAVSPNPVIMNEFAEALGSAMGKPSWLKAPKPMLQLLLGEMSSVMTSSYRVIPQKLQESGFKFDYERIGDAFKAIIGGEYE